MQVQVLQTPPPLIFTPELPSTNKAGHIEDDTGRRMCCTPAHQPPWNTPSLQRPISGSQCRGLGGPRSADGRYPGMSYELVRSSFPAARHLVGLESRIPCTRCLVLWGRRVAFHKGWEGTCHLPAASRPPHPRRVQAALPAHGLHLKQAPCWVAFWVTCGGGFWNGMSGGESRRSSVVLHKQS